MQKESIRRMYYNWEIVRQAIPDGLDFDSDCTLSVNGDLNGDLSRDPSGGWSGFFEYPGKGNEKGYYEVVLTHGDRRLLLSRVHVEYEFDALYFSPKWDNIDKLNDFLSDKYTVVEKEIIYEYPVLGRNIQLLKITDPLVPLAEKQVILLTGRVHNAESGTTMSLLRFVKWLLDGSGQPYLSRYLFLIIPITIPLAMDLEDPRSHDINREWRVDMVEPDLLAIRDRVIDRYVPEIWVDSHNFNAVLDLSAENALRMECGDYLVAHPATEVYFDWDYSRDIARRMVAAAEKHGHCHRGAEFFTYWAKDLNRRGLATEGETIQTEHDDCGIFSGRDYARYADRVKYGLQGRDFAAMAGDYGYERCHSINIITETKPTSVINSYPASDGSVTYNEAIHYPPEYQNSNLLKLQEICLIGCEHFLGQAHSGFPCNLLIADGNQSKDSVILVAWGGNYQDRRLSRQTLWSHRRSITVKTANLEDDENGMQVSVYTCRDILCQAALRVPLPAGSTTIPSVNGQITTANILNGGFLFIPILIRQGKQIYKVSWQRNNSTK